MEEKGLLRRRASAEDLRCRILQLTEQGMSFYDDFTAIMCRMNEIVEQCYTAEELATLQVLLSRLADTLTREVNQ